MTAWRSLPRTRAARSGSEERDQIPFGRTVFPQLVVHAHQTVSGHDPHGDLIGETFRLEIGVMGEHPHVTQLVGHRRIEFLGTQSLQEAVFDRESEWLASIRRRFDRHDERDLRLHRDVDALRYPQLRRAADRRRPEDAAAIERRRFGAGAAAADAFSDEQKEHTGRRESDPRQGLRRHEISTASRGPCLADRFVVERRSGYHLQPSYR